MYIKDRKRIISCAVTAVMLVLLFGCAAPAAAPEATPAETVEKTAPAETAAEEAARVYAPGPFGRISLEVPEGWNCEVLPADGDSADIVYDGLYGLQLSPQDLQGSVQVVYTQSFGVCGTGLKEEVREIAGSEVCIGTYDDQKMWDFVSFGEALGGIVAQSRQEETWPEAKYEETLGIFDTLQFEQDIREGGAGFYEPESELRQLGLMAEAEDITPTGATFVFRLWDPELPTGELIYGNDFTLEKKQDGVWTELPVLLDNRAVEDIGYTIPAGPENNRCEWHADWEQVYGAIEPGEYRIGKSVLDHRAPGDNDKYMIYACFFYAGGPE